jgi:hypothetical protein
LLIKFNLNNIKNMKNIMNKSVLVGSALLLSTALVSAQTTVSGNVDIGYKAVRSNNTKSSSYGVMTKETQLNLQTKGTAGSGWNYAAGFSIENDGTDVGAIGTHTENTYIDLISGNTTISLSADHLPNGNYSITNIVGGVADIDDIAGGIMGQTPIMLSGHGASASFGLGVIQDLGVAKVSFFYAPSGTNTPADNDGKTTLSSATGLLNSFKEITVRGDMGVKGLDAGLVYNWIESDETVAGANADVANYLVSLKYTFANGFALAGELAEAETKAGVNTKTKAIGIGYAINKNTTIGYQMAKSDLSTAGRPTEKIQGINLGYNLGPVAITAVVVKGDDVGATASTGQDGRAAHIGASVKF